MVEKVERLVSVDELSNDQVDIVKVPMDDKGGVMYIGSLSADDFVEWQESKDSGSPDAKKTAAARLITRSLVKGEKDATRIGTEDMVPKWRKAKIAHSERVLKAIFKLNGINQPAEVAVKNG
jgi:hypothetical protein